MKRTVELDDLLEERVDMAKEEVKEALVNYIQNNELYDIETQEELDLLIAEVTELDNDDLRDSISDRITEITDGCVPIYTYDIKTAFFLHSDLLEEAYENMGIGDNPLENDGMTAIWCYIEQEVGNCFDEIAEEAKEEVIEQLRKDNADLPEEEEE